MGLPPTTRPMRPSCGHPALGDVKVGHDLETGKNAGLKAPGDGHDLVEHPVVTESDHEILGLGLEMHVGRALVGGARQHAVDQLDYRSGVDLLADVAKLDRGGFVVGRPACASVSSEICS